MLFQRAILLSLFLASLSGWMHRAVAQGCLTSNFSIAYQGADNQSVVKSLLTSRNEIISAGNINYVRNNLVMADGWISLYSAKGAVIWSKRITAPGFNLLTVRDMTAATDSTYFVTGFVQTYWGVTDPAPPNPNWGILLHLDRYGNILWSKKIDQGYAPGAETTFLENIMRTKEGDLIAHAFVWKRPPFQTKALLLRMDINTNIKWATTYASNVFEFRFNLSNTLRQLPDGSIVAGGIIDERIVARDSILKVNYYWMGIDQNTGNKLWDRSYLIRDKAANVFYPESTIRNITSLPNGDLSFMGYADTNAVTIPPLTTRTVNIVTTATGLIKKVTAYQTDRPGSYIVDGQPTGASGSQLLLMDDGNKAILSELDNTGQVQWKKAYSLPGTAQRPAGFVKAGDGYYLVLNNNAGTGRTYLLKGGQNVDLACRTTTTPLTSFAGDAFFSAADAQMLFNTENSGINLFSGIDINLRPYPLSAITECSDACCHDIVDTINITRATICDNQRYMLPDGHRVTYTGDYFVRHKNANGCDSIKFYRLTVIKDPSALSLGKDTCIEGKDSIILRATPGYENYSWMNTISAQAFYTAKQPGKYSVSVSNACGASTSSIEVQALCDNGLFMPGAFTPNRDNLNDVFRIPPASKYRLISLVIYNRWGELIFSTTDTNKGWDGTYQRIPQQSGLYTYIIVAESTYTGRKRQLTGTVQLIR